MGKVLLIKYSRWFVRAQAKFVEGVKCITVT